MGQKLSKGFSRMTFVIGNYRVFILSTVKKFEEIPLAVFPNQMFCDWLEFSNSVLHQSNYPILHFEKLFFL